MIHIYKYNFNNIKLYKINFYNKKKKKYYWCIIWIESILSKKIYIYIFNKIKIKIHKKVNISKVDSVESYESIEYFKEPKKIYIYYQKIQFS